ncbi:MAG: CAP domain-containing protein [Planctomycetia bacterium]|nr:CAP domain-containing protein [Planctomycetia bacterium]
MLKQLMLTCLAAVLVGFGSARAEEPAKEAPAATPVEKDVFELTSTESTVLEMTNNERVRRGMKPLVIDPSLVESARQHANWMAASHRMQHTTKPVGENIAMGQRTCTEVLNVWMNSSGHRANILGGWNRVGAAAYTSPSGRVYWCLQFLR